MTTEICGYTALYNLTSKISCTGQVFSQIEKNLNIKRVFMYTLICFTFCLTHCLRKENLNNFI